MKEIELMCAGYTEYDRQNHKGLMFSYLEDIQGAFDSAKKAHIEIGCKIFEFHKFLKSYKPEEGLLKGYKINDTWCEGVDTIFLESLNQAFGLKKSSVYNYMKVYEMFGNTPLVEDYSLSQLTELASVDQEEVKKLIDEEKVTPESTIKDIRKIKKELKEDNVSLDQHIENKVADNQKVIVNNIDLEKKKLVLTAVIQYFLQDKDISAYRKAENQQQFDDFMFTNFGLYGVREAKGYFDRSKGIELLNAVDCLASREHGIQVEKDPAYIGYFKYQYSWNEIMTELNNMIVNGYFDKQSLVNDIKLSRSQIKVLKVADLLAIEVYEHFEDLFRSYFDEYERLLVECDENKRNVKLKGELYVCKQCIKSLYLAIKDASNTYNEMIIGSEDHFTKIEIHPDIQLVMNRGDFNDEDNV